MSIQTDVSLKKKVPLKHSVSPELFINSDILFSRGSVFESAVGTDPLQQLYPFPWSSDEAVWAASSGKVGPEAQPCDQKSPTLPPSSRAHHTKPTQNSWEPFRTDRANLWSVFSVTECVLLFSRWPFSQWRRGRSCPDTACLSSPASAEELIHESRCWTTVQCLSDAFH